MNLQRPNVFEQDGVWLKGSLHFHSTNSDGRLSPEKVLEYYRPYGFDFLCFGDHWCTTMPAVPLGGPLLIPGCELDTWSPTEPGNTHIMCVGVDKAPQHPDKSKPRPPAQDLLDLALRSSEYCFLAHPYWSLQSGTRLLDLRGLYAIEVYNHGCEMDIGMGFAEMVWDELLNEGRKIDAFATDDSHWRPDEERANYPGGYVMVRAKACTREAIIAAFKSGCFYSTMGPEIKSVRFDNGTVSVTTSPATRILFRTNKFYGLHVTAPEGGTITEASMTIDRTISSFLRIEVHDARGRKAWTNPFYFA